MSHIKALLAAAPLAVAPFAVALVAVALVGTSLGTAQATPLSGSFNVRIWNSAIGSPNNNAGSSYQQGSFTNPLAATVPLATGTYVGSINFNDPAGGTDTIGGFFKTATSTVDPFAGITTVLSTGGYSRVSLIEFTFTTATAISGSIVHDDGISIWNAANTAILVNAAAPTTASPTSYSLAAGTYNLWYAEANGLPAVLNFDVPEPASLALLGAGLAGLGMIRRRRG